VFERVAAFSNTTLLEGFRVKTIIRRKLANSKRRIERRLDKTDVRGCGEPMMTASNIHYEIANRTRGIAAGGMGSSTLSPARSACATPSTAACNC
jgi:hypothetical protein